jgi:uncharacterized protein YggE
MIARSLMILGATATVAAAQTPQHMAELPQIVTSGQAEVKVTPDRATVHVGMYTTAATAAAAAAENNRKQTAIIDAIRALGIPAQQITTMNYNVHPEMRHDPQPRGGVSTPPKVVGYVVTNTVRVELRRIDQVGPVIDAALAKGSNQIHGVEFSASTADSARRDALAEAVARARADAEVMARAAGGRIGGLLELSTSGPSVRPMYASRQVMMEAAGSVAAPTPIQPGEQSVSAFVSARWSFISGSANR